MVDTLPSIVFMGTPDFALPSLEALIDLGASILLVVSQPDRPKGRGRKVVAPPTKRMALDRGLRIYQPESVRSAEVVERIGVLKPECVVVVAYGQLLPVSLLGIPSLGAVNVHASLLPKYRGPAPIQWALIQGEATTGVTTMFMAEGMDTGELLLQREIAIQPDDTATTLHDRLAHEGADLLVATLEGLKRGDLQARPQDESRATYAPLLSKEDGRVDWYEDAKRICCRIRGLDPWPGGFTQWEGRRLKLFGCRVLPHLSQASPGTVIAVTDEGVQVATGEGVILVETLQLEGRRPLSVRDFVRGHPLQAEAVFGA
jgi:methionyl-tRNA formyltransferase